jgi:murein DD-endopeptidase MepM/ murein hydrolase activator NlpD
LAQHRADSRQAARRRTGADPTARTTGRQGRRRAGKPVRAHHLAPRLVGGVAVLLAAAGAVTLTPGSSSALIHGADVGQSLSTSVSRATLSAADKAALANRTRAVSRDAQRETRADAADKRLQAATEKAAKQRTTALAAVARSSHVQADRIAQDTWVLPVTPGTYHLTARFGSCSGLWSHCHTGLDFAGATGSPVHAVAAGTITEVGYAGAYGNRTIMTLPDGTDLWYCHQTASTVQVGQQVTAGEVIGSVGSTGNTTGPHLHLEVRPGGKDPVDPYSALVAHGLTP